MIDTGRSEVLRALEELSEACPEYRLGQMIADLAMLALGDAEGAIWDMEDADLLAAARKHLADWNARHEPAAVSQATAVEVVREFWRLMASNDFYSVAAVLAHDFVLEWPQSKERIRGPERFARLNREYPAHGPWRFTVRRILGGEAEAVSEVEVTDGVQNATAISFFTVESGKITRLVEYWPEPYAAAANRAHLVEAME